MILKWLVTSTIKMGKEKKPTTLKYIKDERGVAIVSF